MKHLRDADECFVDAINNYRKTEKEMGRGSAW